MSTANTIQIAAKLYDARDAMKFLYGERYEAEIRKDDHSVAPTLGSVEVADDPNHDAGL
jgi:hypothetical protein